MGKCRYDLSEDCNSKRDCLICVLGKIRAEIEQNAYPIVHGVNNHEKGMTLYGILQIIDKYKAESEDKPFTPINFLSCNDITDIIDES